MKFNRVPRFIIFFSFAGIIFSACERSDEPEPIFENTYLVSLEEIDVVEAWQVKAATSFFDFEDLNKYIISDAHMYRMVYNTTYNGDAVQASGVIGIPSENDSPMAIASLHHGTSIKKTDAPSESPSDSFILAAVATTGMITLIPDFLGFGASEQQFHPYYIEEGEAIPIVDMIHATVELMEDSAFVWNELLYLTGYSEGGYVTMAAHKYIQEHPDEGLTVTASAPAAGGYDLLHMKDYFFKQETYSEPFYLAYVISAYKTWYNWAEPLSTFFQEPYASKIPGLLDGSKSGNEINIALTKDVGAYLQADMINEFDSDVKYSEFKQALVDNSLLDWVPTAPVRMYHGTADIKVPFSNSVATYESLKENGAGDNLQFIAIEGGDHSSGLLPMFKDAILWILEMD
jgi:pimeloyl-ACP methyl ester carboxylesterase